MTSITNLKLNNNAVQNEVSENKKVEIIEQQGGTAIEFPNLTTRFGASTYVPTLVFTDDVISGNVENEIQKISNVQEQIETIVKANSQASVLNLSEANLFSTASTVSSAKTISFTAYTGASTNYNEKTDISSAMDNFQPDITSSISEAEQKKIFQTGMQTLADWIDNYIANYNTVLEEGRARQDAETKISFLLEIRKAIENCDFPVGFAPQETNYDENGNATGMALGCYQWGYIPGEYLNPQNTAYVDRGAEHDYNRSILLNTDYFAFQRQYTNEYDAVNAFLNGNATYLDVAFANDETYYKYTGACLAATLIHEFVHSTHISNEAVTYFICEVIEDDFANMQVGTTYSNNAVNAVNLLGINLNTMKYSDLYTPYTLTNKDGTSQVSYFSMGHNLGDINEIAAHGHQNNLAHTDTYTNMSGGNTVSYDKQELLNFVVNA